MFKVSILDNNFIKKELTDYLCENKFFKLEEELYFIAEDLRGYKNIHIGSDEELYSGIVVSIQGNELFIDDRSITPISSNIENTNAYISNAHIPNNISLFKELNKNAFLSLFNFLRPEFGKSLIEYNESILHYILACIKTYNEEIFASADEDEVTLEVMRHFKLKSKLVPGYYDGNIIFSDIKLYDIYGKKEICSLGNQPLGELIYLEDDDKDSLAAVAESLTKEQIIETFIKSLQSKVD